MIEGRMIVLRFAIAACVIGMVAGPAPPTGVNELTAYMSKPRALGGQPGKCTARPRGIGTAVIEITAIPHNGCASFAARYGRDATVFVNTAEGRQLRLRGIYGRVTKDGLVSVGDKVAKLPATA